jgi:hypothetical protein
MGEITVLVWVIFDMLALQAIWGIRGFGHRVAMSIFALLKWQISLST